ncbi:acyltransferase [Dapis sp. BLCC M126]|uniref:acyltransferase n=1 Tax=Dapis sp. BLCC M126 TaxID=3400189 RepID=UPI003CE95F65
MTLLSILLSWFPTALIFLAIGSLISICIHPNFTNILCLIFTLYGIPLIIYRIHNIFYPIEPGVTYLLGKKYSPWWGSHQIQIIYIAFPILEIILRFIPGLFSIWLRLWGAKIGRNIYWTPKLEIADRGLIEIGNNVVFGYGVQLYSHVIKPKNDNLMLYTKKITIGNNVFIGAGSRFGPGVKIKDETFIPVTTDIYPNKNANTH